MDKQKTNLSLHCYSTVPKPISHSTVCQAQLKAAATVHIFLLIFKYIYIQNP